MTAPRIILGIDPGLAQCGWAVINAAERTVLAAGTIKTNAQDHHNLRTLAIGVKVAWLTSVWQPELVAIEAFTGRGEHANFKALLTLRVIERITTICDSLQLPHIEVPTTRCKASVGLTGKVPKSRVKTAVSALFRGAEKATNQHARDAVVAAWAGYAAVKEKGKWLGKRRELEEMSK